MRNRDAKKNNSELDYGKEYHVEKDSEENDSKESCGEEEIIETESSEEEMSEEDSFKEDGRREDASYKRGTKEVRLAHMGSITPATYVSSPKVEAFLWKKDDLRHNAVSNIYSPNPFESDSTWASLDKLYQICHHCVAAGKPPIHK